MNTTKPFSFLLFMMLLSSVVVLAICSGTPSPFSVSKKPHNERSDEDLLKNVLLFGRIKNLTINEEYSTAEAVNLRIIFFGPVQTFHYICRQSITFSNQHAGIRRDSFVLGSFTVVLPINTNSIAVMNTTMGTMLIELYEDKTPNTTANFIRLANDGFYDGLVFHRVIDDFVIQGGGYYQNGTEKESPYGPIDLEINPEVHHLDGTIGMARTSDPNSATNQFFIDDGAQRQLEPNDDNPYGYAAFGRVIKGIDVVRKIAQVETMTKYGFMKDWPVDDVIIESVTIIGP